MLNSAHKHFAFDFREIIIDEIALEGLEGIGIDLLWRRVEKRISSPVTEKMRTRFWGFIVHNPAISFYQLSEPLPYVELRDRFALIHEETGHVQEPPEPLEGPYEYNPVEGEYGSCAHTNRVTICRDTLMTMPYERVWQEYKTMVMVASIEERWKALAPHMPITELNQMTPYHYCILEIIGKGRENGQMTTGASNLSKIVKDSKLLFYNRKYLQTLGLVKVLSINQSVNNKTVKSLLLRLKRFHKPPILSLPKSGIFNDILQYLLQQPGYSDITGTMVKKGILTQAQLKKISKNFNNIFDFDSIMINENAKNKNVKVQRKVIRLNPTSDESSQSEDETADETVNSRYKVHVSLMRQAFERFLEAGLKGLTQQEIAETLGVEFYTSRAICRSFKLRNLVRELYEDKGKQRRTRYIAVSAAANEFDAKYEEEKKKFMGYVSETKNAKRQISKAPPTIPDSNKSDEEVPTKKIKLEDTAGYESIVNEVTMTEVSSLDGMEHLGNSSLLSSKKSPTLRQLKYANGIVKVIREKLVISGYQHLSYLVAKEINEPPMDPKSLKVFVQKLVTDGQIKVIKMTWPGQPQNSCTILCAPHIQTTDPLIKLKYRELNLRAIRNRTTKQHTITPDPAIRSMSIHLYPRYMKIQKLHEFIMKFVYFNDDPTYHSNFQPGFSSLVNIVPEFTIDFLLPNMSNIALTEISKVKIPKDVMHLKLRDTPPDIFKAFLVSSTIQKSLRTYLSMLAMFGLVQIIRDPDNKMDTTLSTYVFYVNKRAKIIDTTGIWPRDNVDIKSLEKTYFFDSFKEVETYWKDVYNISLRTTIDLEGKLRTRKHPIQVPRLVEEVEENDNGQVLGNGLGPCGMDSSFHMDEPRYWSAHYTKFLKKPTMLPKNVVLKVPKCKTKRIRKSTKKHPTPKVVKPKVEKKPELRTRKRGSMSAFPKWSIEEDRIIMLCKAAMTVMSPIAQPGCLTIRNVVAKQILSAKDPKKVATHCHKRSITVETSSTLSYERDCVLNELKRHPQLVRKYEQAFKILRIQYSGNMTKLTYSARLPMLELVYIMLQIVQSESFNRKVPCVALNLKEFNENFTMAPSYVNKNYNMFMTPLEAGPTLATVKEGIIFSVITSSRFETSDVANIIYSTFKDYPESVLRPAIEQLRKCGALAAKEKLINNHMQKFSLQETMRSSYKISSFYFKHWNNRLSSGFSQKIVNILLEEMPKTEIKGNPEVNCVLLELMACDKVDVTLTTTPVITGPANLMQEEVSVLEIMMNFKLKSGSMGWSHKSDSKSLFDHFQDVEFENIMYPVIRNAKVEYATEISSPEDDILNLLRIKKENGATFQELQEFTNYDTRTLTVKLQSLESSHVIKRVGYFENVVVLTEFIKTWTITVVNRPIVPTPWITPNLEVRKDLLVEWAAHIMNKIFKHPGCSISYLGEKSDYLSTRAIQEACVILEKAKCVYLKCIKVTEPDLFSEEGLDPELTDYNEYDSVKNILVFPVKDALTRFSYFKHTILDEDESYDSV